MIIFICLALRDATFARRSWPAASANIARAIARTRTPTTITKAIGHNKRAACGERPSFWICLGGNVRNAVTTAITRRCLGTISIRPGNRSSLMPGPFQPQPRGNHGRSLEMQAVVRELPRGDAFSAFLESASAGTALIADITLSAAGPRLGAPQQGVPP